MKLEVKYLSPYLSHELRVLILSTGTTDDIKSIDNVIKMVNFGHGNAKEFHEIKPILHPLSDLTKEIEIKGYNRKIVPMQKLCREFAYNEQYPKEWRFGVRVRDKIHFASATDGIMMRLFEYNEAEKFFILSNPRDNEYGFNVKQFDAFQKLFEWHFDVFGLIESGLAIDINTL